MMEYSGFKNNDGTLALVAMNRTEADMVYEIICAGETFVVACPPRGIQTLIME
jgi:O-glycosyl hydrolase